MAAYHALSDGELTALMKGGDAAAYSEIYSRYWKKIFVIAHKRLSDQLEAEEIVQDIFVNLWKKRETFLLKTAYPNYFAVAVKFEILDLMRKRANALAYEKDLAFSYTESDESILRQMDPSDLQEKLQLTIRSLPEKCQLVFRLKYEQDYSQKEISAELGISEKTVEAHLAKARKTLKEKFGGLLGAVLFLYL